MFDETRFDRHPDTGAVFAEVTVPFWDEVRDITARAAPALPLGSLGWDVALTPEGPVLIEANYSWGIDTMQMGWGGLGMTEIGRRALEHRDATIRPRAQR